MKHLPLPPSRLSSKFTGRPAFLLLALAVLAALAAALLFWDGGPAAAQDASSDASLSNLYISGSPFTQSFDPARTEYAATVGQDQSKAYVRAQVNHAEASAAITGARVVPGGWFIVSLDPRPASIAVVVTAEDGSTQRTYTMGIDGQLPAPASANAQPHTHAYSDTDANAHTNTDGHAGPGAGGADAEPQAAQPQQQQEEQEEDADDNTDATLSSLQVFKTTQKGPDSGEVVRPTGTAYTLTPAFDSQVTQYTVKIPDEGETGHAEQITAVVTANAAAPVTFRVTGRELSGQRPPKQTPNRGDRGNRAGADEGNGPWASGPWDVPYGYTWIDVKVTAPDGTTTKTYTVKVEYGTLTNPRNLKLTPGDKQLTLTWEHPASRAAHNYFARWRKASAGSGWLNQGNRDTIFGSAITGAEGGIFAWSVGGRTLGYVIRGLENGVEYEVQLQALLGGARNIGLNPPDERKDDWITSDWVSARGAPLHILTITPTSPTRAYGGTDDLGYTVSGLTGSDTAANVVSGALTRAAGNDAGTYAFDLSGLSIASAYASKYGLPSRPSVANYTITAKPVTYTSTAADKTYDGTTDAPSALGGSFATGDVLSGDTVTVSGGSYASADVGAGLAVTGMSLGGADAGNYTATFNVTGDVTARPITAISGVTVNSRAADGSADATFDTSNAQGTGVLTTELTDFRAGGLQVSGSFPAATVGTHAVSVTYSLQDQGSFKAGNYSLSVTTATLSGEITAATTDAAAVRASCAPVGQDDDTDDPNLINISTLAQLDAMRWDADGDGVSDSASNAAAYAAAGLGCPDGGCVGYELTADLDFDTNGSGQADAGDAYWNGGAGWNPIRDFKAVFDGNGHTISNLHLNTDHGFAALFARVLHGGVIRNVGLESVDVTGAHSSGIAAGLVAENDGKVTDSYVTGAVSGARIAGGLAGWTGSSSVITASYSTASVSGAESVGGLVGDNTGAIIAGCAAGSVSGHATTPGEAIGGLVGHHQAPGYVIASHASGDVTVGSQNNVVGGLIGYSRGPVTASYAVGSVTGGGRYVSALIGQNLARLADSYWNTETAGGIDYYVGKYRSGQGIVNNLRNDLRPGVGKTTAELQSPTGYAGIYANWNVDLDGDGQADDPWDFGTASQYPTLQYSSLTLAAAPRTPATGTDYDDDNDGLIEISSLAQLNAIRWDVNGDGGPNSADYAAGYAAAFPDAVAGMGCPSTGCVGYELTADLDFDTNDNGQDDAGDAYWNGGRGWMPIQDDGLGYRAILEGNGHTIRNLYIDNRSDALYIGLFRSLIHPGEVRNLGLGSVNVSAGASGDSIGALVGENGGTISGSYMTGTVSGNYAVGGLVGSNIRSGVIASSYAAGNVSGDGRDVGGLVGYNWGRIIASYSASRVAGDSEYAGGLVGYNDGSITASYAAGPVSGEADNVGGLIGVNAWQTSANYWDTQTTGQSAGTGGTGKTTSELQTPTDYAGIYTAWNVDLDGDGSADDPWDFGTDSQYPALKGVGPSVSGQRFRLPGGSDFQGGSGAEPERPAEQQRVVPSDYTATVPPGRVVNLRLSDAADSVTVSWDAPQRGDAPTRYIAHLKPSDGGKGKTHRPQAGKTTTTFRSLEAGATYNVWVRAQNEAGKGERVHASITLPDGVVQGGEGDPPPEQQQVARTFSVSAAATAAEGNDAALTITLNEDAPAGGVAFTVTAGYAGGATATAADVGSITSPVTVTAGNDMLQIAIPTADDAVDEDDETFTVAIAAATAGWEKEGDRKDAATVTITDDDTAGVTVTPTALNISEDGSGSYTVVLDSKPTADVTVTPTGSDGGAATFAPASYTFTSSDWNTARTFTVSGVADADRNGESVSINHDVASSDGKYDGVAAASVSVAVADTTPAPASASCSEETEPPVSGQKEPYNICVTPGDGILTVTWTAAPREGVADEDILHALRWSQESGVWANPPGPSGAPENGIVVEGGVASYTITGLENGVATGVFVRSFTGNSYSERSEHSSKWVRTKGPHTTPKAAE